MDSEKQEDEIFSTVYDPTSLYNDTLQQVLKGLLAAIKIHNGRLDQVRPEDILANSDVSSETLLHYFKNVSKIMEEIYREISIIISQVEKSKERFRTDAVIRILLENLRKQHLMLKIIFALDDRRIWEKNLTGIVEYVSSPWESRWNRKKEELYHMFCFQFHVALNHWSESEFADEQLEPTVICIEAWIEADADYVFFVSMERPVDEYQRITQEAEIKETYDSRF